MKHAPSRTSSTITARRTRHAGWLAVGALALAACGGGDDDASSSTTSSTTLPIATETSTTLATETSTTVASTTVPVVVDLVTEGATVIVANSSNVNGAAGRMTDRLAIAGFTMGEATNGSEGQLEVTKIYFDPANENAQPVAESLRAALGGGDIQLFEMGVPAPTESGDIGDATIVVSMGNDTADKSLEELQGLVAPSTDATDDTTDDSTDDTTDDSTDDTTETSEPESDG